MVEDFFHGCPPLTLRAVGEWLLHGFHDGPPALRSGVSSHPAHVCFVVLANVLEVPEQAAISEKDGVVADVARRDGVEHGRPNGLVMLPVGHFGLRSQVDDHSIASHEGNDDTATYSGPFERSFGIDL